MRLALRWRTRNLLGNLKFRWSLFRHKREFMRWMRQRSREGWQ